MRDAPLVELEFARKSATKRGPTMVQLAALMLTTSLLTFAALVLIFELLR